MQIPPDALEAPAAEPCPLEVDPSWAGRWLHLRGPAPLAHPALLEHIAALDALGAHVRLELAHTTELPALRSAGVQILRLRLHALDPAAHEAFTGITGSHARTLATLSAAREEHGLKVELLAVPTTANQAHLLALARWCQEEALELHLEPHVQIGSPRLAALRLSPGATADLMATLRPFAPHMDAMRGPPMPLRPAPPLPWSPALQSMLQLEVPQRDIGGGCTGAESTVETGLRLAAWRCPPIDRPPAQGGPGIDPRRTLPVWQAPQGHRIGILHAAMSDVPMTLHTLPALAEALESKGGRVRWMSAWGERDDLRSETSGPARRAQLQRAHQAPSPALGDLSGLDVVLAPTWSTGAEALANPSLDPTTRVVVADFHMLDGIDGWTSTHVPDGTHPSQVDWWPSERVHVHSCFPGHSRLYAFRNIPQQQLLWRPYPLDRTTFAPGPPAESCVHGFAGGNQNRAWPLLAQAAGHLDGVREITLYTRHDPGTALPRPLTWRPPVDLLDFYEALRASRYVVVPVRYRPDVASGITVIVMALASGRPVITTRTAATMDHVRHGINGWLVPADRPDRLAKAIRRLDEDDALVARLAHGAAQAATRIDVTTWAEELLEGGTPQRVVGRGPYAPW